MMKAALTSSERLAMIMSHREADRIPFILPLTMHCANELGLTLRDYFSRADYVAEGQLRALAKYRHDGVIAAYYASLELEAWGGETIFYDAFPPNAGAPIINKAEEILKLRCPELKTASMLQRCLETIRILKTKVGESVPVLGSVISPFSLPIIQMGFEHYLDLLYERRDLWERLMDVNAQFCIAWANAQLAAGASAISYADPLASTDLIPAELFRQTGFGVAQKVIAKIKGPVATTLASARSFGSVDDIVKTGAVALSVSALEDLRALKKVCRGRITMIGNLNGIEMRNWTNASAEEKVKEAIAHGARGGGFVLADHHGEIPAAVTEDILMAISEAVYRWGKYPLTWCNDDEE
ncbi:uroporphyrinogen decarboxylase family protein [Azotosporobacter soli]|uniref:uroporphyrinogen decarboxylase family protein n=1 Tax=Azotosporobacter soli TaxID=3055040 RepID=UPI0031FF3050